MIQGQVNSKKIWAQAIIKRFKGLQLVRSPLIWFQRGCLLIVCFLGTGLPIYSYDHQFLPPLKASNYYNSNDSFLQTRVAPTIFYSSCYTSKHLILRLFSLGKTFFSLYIFSLKNYVVAKIVHYCTDLLLQYSDCKLRSIIYFFSQ